MNASSSARRRLGALAALATLPLAACQAQPGAAPAAIRPALSQGSEPATLDPARFTVDITNPYWPMKPGDRWVYQDDGQHPVQRVEVTVTDRTRRMADGIEAREIHDRVTTPDGALVEDTLDWYAQDADGNLWYLGEKTAEYQNGKATSTTGTWEAGVDGAQPGILIPAHPTPGLQYQQEYLKGEAEDHGFVLSTAEQVQVRTGTYRNSLMTRETTPLEPDLVELKFYARDIGPTLTVPISGGAGRVQLTESTRAG
jgi:hypothetical protein